MTEYVYGIHAADALLKHQPEMVKIVYFNNKATSKRIAGLIEAAQKLGMSVQAVSNERLESMTKSAVHQGIVLAVNPFVLKTEGDLKVALQSRVDAAFYLILDSIQDPHNLGACIRTAEALGVHGIIFPQSKSATVTASVRKVACGAEMGVPIYQVSNLARCIDLLKEAGIWVLGTDLEAKMSLSQFDMKQNVAIVMGNEQNGLRALTKKQCDALVSIPLVGMTQSLNVSVATGICLFEIVRQRLA